MSMGTDSKTGVKKSLKMRSPKTDKSGICNDIEATLDDFTAWSNEEDCDQIIKSSINGHE